MSMSCISRVLQWYGGLQLCQPSPDPNPANPAPQALGLKDQEGPLHGGAGQVPSVCFEKDGGHFIWHFKNRGVSGTGEAREGTKAGRKTPLGTSVLGEGKRETDMSIGAKKSRRGPLQMPGLKWARNHRMADSGLSILASHRT